MVDTYNVLKSGVPNAIRVFDEVLKPMGVRPKGVRIDSGDITYITKKARKMLDEAGYPDAKICLSNGLNEYSIRDLLKQGAVIDSIGAGDNIAAPKERVGGVYKLVAVEEKGEIIPKIKVSNDTAKTINPGYKKVYRFYDKKTGYALGDLIALHNEKISKEAVPVKSLAFFHIPLEEFGIAWEDYKANGNSDEVIYVDGEHRERTCCSPFADCRSYESVTVACKSLYSHEKRSGNYLPRIAADGADLNLSVSGNKNAAAVLYYGVKSHCNVMVIVSPFFSFSPCQMG